jgi:hypothetical protein
MSGARGYSWPPFEPGNGAAIKHGATSRRRVQPLADELARQCREVAPWVGVPAFAATVADWSWCWRILNISITAPKPDTPTRRVNVVHRQADVRPRPPR